MIKTEIPMELDYVRTCTTETCIIVLENGGNIFHTEIYCPISSKAKERKRKKR
jgi:hypothetical protein